MKLKTIKKTLSSKFNRWANSITDEALRKLVMENTIITGGAIVSLLQGEAVNDFDLYFRNHDTCLKVANYYAQFFPGKVEIRSENGLVSIRTDPDITYNGDEEASDESPVAVEGKDEKFNPIFMSSNAITLSDKIQIVVRFYGEPEEIHKNYDFVHCTCYWKSWDDELVTPVRALTSMMSRELIYVGSKYPLCSLIRIRKFIARNWTINAGQMLKIVMQLSDLDLHNPAVLQDQLVGVDSAYFAEVLNRLADKNVDRVDTAYLCEIIDRIF